MADPSAIDPGSSSYSNLPKADDAKVGDVPTMPLERVLPRQTSTGVQRGIQQLGSPNVYVDSGNEQVVVARNETANTSTPRVLMGNQANYGEGLYVTKEGIDATAASSDADFIFNSNQNVFKIVKKLPFNAPSGTVANPGAGLWGASTVSISVPHDLNYAPIVQVYEQDATSSNQLPYTTSTATGGIFVSFNYRVSVNDVDVTISLDITVLGTSATALSFPGIIYVLQETASSV